MDYTKLDVWIKSRALVKEVYKITKSYPKSELYGLINQMRRCVVSVPSNIAEGSGRKTPKDIMRFLYISRGSLYELETQIYVSYDLDYISKGDFEELINGVLNCKRLLNGFINYYKKFDN